MCWEPNLEFSEDFFKAEVREDFYIDATMKTVWAAELELLSDIDAVCQKYNLQYFAGWGTMLGAVRHKGFVPWDDDMDIMMKRSDYNKLMSVLPKELPDSYRVYHAMSEEGHDLFWGCVTNADTISIEENRLHKFHNCPFWVGIDIFPLDYIPKDEDEASLVENLMELIKNTVSLFKKENKTEEEKQNMEDGIEYIEKSLNLQLDKNKSIPAQLWRWGNMLASSYGEEDADGYIDYAPRKGIIHYEKDVWDEVFLTEYEEFMIPVPQGYHDVLTKTYGDYSVRTKGGASHNYPYYNKQLNQLRDMIQQMEKK